MSNYKFEILLRLLFAVPTTFEWLVKINLDRLQIIQF